MDKPLCRLVFAVVIRRVRSGSLSLWNAVRWLHSSVAYDSSFAIHHTCSSLRVLFKNKNGWFPVGDFKLGHCGLSLRDKIQLYDKGTKQWFRGSTASKQPATFLKETPVSISKDGLATYTVLLKASFRCQQQIFNGEMGCKMALLLSHSDQYTLSICSITVTCSYFGACCIRSTSVTFCTGVFGSIGANTTRQ